MLRKVESMTNLNMISIATLAISALIIQTTAGAATPQSELQRWQQAAGQPGDAGRGQVFFGRRHDGEWSCASCHGQPPTQDSKHASTGKRITALAPAFNAERFTDSAKADKWFKRNCKDVVSRECTALEKADVMAYLLGLK
jgi:hypothetical protein